MTGFNPASQGCNPKNVVNEAENQEKCIVEGLEYFSIKSEDHHSIEMNEQHPVTEEVPPQDTVALKNNEITLKNLYSHSLKYDDKEKDRLIYVFDYSNETKVIKTNKDQLLPLNITSLTYLKTNKEWDLFKHPYILNYLNEILINSVHFYIAYLSLYALYMISLYSYISTNNEFPGGLCIVFIILLLITVIANFVLKRERDISTETNGCCVFSLKFAVAKAFAILHYFIALICIIISWPSVPKYSTLHENFIWWFEIIVIATSWIQCLCVLKKSHWGLYVLMLTKIFKSFRNLLVICVTTVISFSFAFEHAMRKSGVYPWDDANTDNITINKSTIKSFTKVSVMMIGEIDAGDIIKSREWMGSVILVLFEIIVIIIIMNLMMSLAVDDVIKLRQSAKEKLLRIKINYCVEILHLSQYPCFHWVLDKSNIRFILIDTKKEQFSISTTKLNVKFLPIDTFSGGTYLSFKDVKEIEKWKIESNEKILVKYDNKSELEADLNSLEDEEGCYTKMGQKFIGLSLKNYATKKCTCACCQH